MSRSRPEARPAAGALRARVQVLAFSLIGLGCVLVTATVIALTWVLDRHAAELVDDIFASSQAVHRLQHAVDLQRALLVEHALGGSAAERTQIERNLSSAGAEVAAAARAYTPLATAPGERAAWELARADLASLEEAIGNVLAASRTEPADASERARRMADLWFVALDRDLDALNTINGRAAARTAATTSELRAGVRGGILGVGAISLTIVVLLGAWSVRESHRREVAAALHAQVLEQRNRDLDAFGGRVAHDIRGPLTTISLACARLGKVAPGELGTVEMMKRAVGRIEVLMEDLLALARVEAQMRGSCDPARVVLQIGEELARSIEEGRGAMTIDAAHATVRCSEGLLRQALANLAENALKYRRPDVAPRLAISGTIEEGDYRLRVADNGAGMTPEEARRAFEPFFRAPRFRDQPGSGLGLSIVKRVAEASGGSVSVESTVGEGSTFTLRVPLAPPEGLTAGARA